MTSYTPEELYESAMNYFKLGDRPRRSCTCRKQSWRSRTTTRPTTTAQTFCCSSAINFDAVLNYDKAISMSPRTPEYHNNRGAALMELNALHDAEKSYLHAIDLKPHFEQAQMNLGNVLKILGRFDEARTAYERRSRQIPDYIDAHLHLASWRSKPETTTTDWREFEYRWKSGQVPERGLPYPRWNGEPSIRTMEFCSIPSRGSEMRSSFAAMLRSIKERYGCKVYVEVRAQLTRIVKTMKGIDGVIAFAEQPPADVKYCAPTYVMSAISSGRQSRRYHHRSPICLRIRDAQTGSIQAWPSSRAAVRVGICWAGYNRAGNPGAAAIDRRRSMLLSQFAPLGMVSNISWVSLQKGPPSDQVKEPPKGMTILHCMEECDDFADTAALMSKLDLVISVDTSSRSLGGSDWSSNLDIEPP